MSYNEQETRFFLIDPVLRDKGYTDHQRIKMETPAPVEPTGPKGRRRKANLLSSSAIVTNCARWPTTNCPPLSAATPVLAQAFGVARP